MTMNNSPQLHNNKQPKKSRRITSKSFVKLNQKKIHTNNVKSQNNQQDTENQCQQEVNTQSNESEKSNEIQNSLSCQNISDEQIKKITEPDISSDELNTNNEDQIQQQPLTSLTVDSDELLVESNSPFLINEIKSQTDSNDNSMMTKNFINAISNTQNPFSRNYDLNKSNEIEIIHHDMLTSNKHTIQSIDQINPQSLPIENEIYSNKKQNNAPYQ